MQLNGIRHNNTRVRGYLLNDVDIGGQGGPRKFQDFFDNWGGIKGFQTALTFPAEGQDLRD